MEAIMEEYERDRCRVTTEGKESINRRISCIVQAHFAQENAFDIDCKNRMKTIMEQHASQQEQCKRACENIEDETNKITVKQCEAGNKMLLALDHGAKRVLNPVTKDYDLTEEASNCIKNFAMEHQQNMTQIVANAQKRIDAIKHASHAKIESMNQEHNAKVDSELKLMDEKSLKVKKDIDDVVTLGHCVIDKRLLQLEQKMRIDVILAQML